MISFDNNKMDTHELAELYFNLYTPRLVVLLTTTNLDANITNGAPFSFVTLISTNPGILGVSIMRKNNGESKDTFNNIVKNKEAVINILSSKYRAEIDIAGIEFPSNISEISNTDLTLEKSNKVSTMKIKEASIQFETVLHSVTEVTEGCKIVSDFVMLKVVSVSFKEDIYDKTERKVKLEKLDSMVALPNKTYIDANQYNKK